MMRRTDLAFVVLVISAVVLALPDNAMASPAPPEGQEIWTQVTVTYSQPYKAQKGNPVAVVYYRCEQQGKGTKCNPRDGYYVHNGVALAELPTTNGGAHLSHVPTWEKREKPDQLYICGAEMAAKAAEDVPVEGIHCHGDHDDIKLLGSPWRAWVVKAIYTYSIGQPNYSIGQPPIAWRTTVSGKETVHDGAFKCFIKPRSLDCNPDIKNAGGQGTLEYWHYVNATPDTGESGRTAKRWEKFTLESGKDDATAVGDNIEIKPQ